MARAALAHLADLDMARVARMHSKNGAVTSYAGMILKEHQESLQELTKLMREKNIAQPDTFDGETKQDIDRMASLSGAEFDREFITDQVKNQREALGLYESEAQAGQNPRLRSVARESLPLLRRDLQRTEELAARLGA